MQVGTQKVTGRVGQPKVDDRRVRKQPASLLHGLRATPGEAYDLEPGVLRQRRRQAFPDDLVVIDEQYPQPDPQLVIHVRPDHAASSVASVRSAQGSARILTDEASLPKAAGLLATAQANTPSATLG